MSLLRRGDFAPGWQNYEYRLRTREARPRKFDRPRWQGEDLNGRRILLHVEQGFGDMVQFLRYVPQVIERNGRVVLETPAELLRLLESAWAVERMVRLGEDPGDFDVHCPLLSLPGVFGTTAATIPAATPYLWPPPRLVDHWNRRIGPRGERLRVGLAWAGRPFPPGRSVPLELLAPLAEAGDIDFYSLQKGDAAAESAKPPAGLRWIDWSSDVRDFADVAAIVAAVDLVIGIDTAAAHLAGAMGKPVWVMLRHVADWRWLAGREDSPWYPSMRLFRQQKPGEWRQVVEQVAMCLRDQSLRPSHGLPHN